MLRFKNAKVLVFVFMPLLLIGLSLSAFGKVLFEEDFEAETLDKEPSRWDIAPPKFGPQENFIWIAEDPENPGNKVLAQIGEANGGGATVPTGWKSQDFWTDYIWEFDRRWDKDTAVAAMYRYQSPEKYYLISHRSPQLRGGGNLRLILWDGNFNLLADELKRKEGGQ